MFEPKPVTGLERPLGFSEARMHCMHTLFAGTTQCVAAVGVRGPFQEGAFRAAVDEIAARHQILSCTIVELNGTLRFAAAASPRAAVSVVDGVAWQELYQTLNSTPLPLDRSPWAVFVARGGSQPDAWEVLLTTHHALMDGGSIALFMQQLFAEYAARLRADAQCLPRAARPLPPAAESMLPRTLDWPDFVAHQARVAAGQPKIEPDPHRADAAHHERRTQSLFFSLEPDTAGALARAATEQGVTLNSWVAACLLQAVEEHSPGRTRFALGTAFSLRALCEGLGPEDLGCHLAVMSTFHEASLGRPIQDVARQHGRLLTRAVFDSARHPHRVELPALHRTMEPMRGIRAFVGDIAYTYAESGLESGYPPLHIEHFFASASRALGAASVVLHGLRHAGAVHFSVNYTSPLQSSRWVDDVTAALRRGLAKSVGLAPP
ncbi:MAG: hypothetical protein ABW061_18885 [Polyangiaceae bacterium]